MKRLLVIVIIAAVVIAAALAVIILPGLDKPIEQDNGGAADYFEADEVMLELSGEDLEWEEYYDWLKYGKASYEQTYGEITDWTAEASDGVPYYEAIKDYTLYIMKVYKALEDYAAENHIELTEQEEADIENAWGELASIYGSEEALLSFVNETFGSREMYEYFSEMSLVYTKSLESIYGQGAEKLTDEDVLDYIEGEEYMMVYHILIKTVDDNNEPLPDDEIATQTQKAKEILAEIDAFEGSSEEKKEFFIGLVGEHSEDTGGADGYLFLPGYMVEEFQVAAEELEEYEHSGLVESDYGYHIILKLPIDPDKTPLEYMQQGYTSTLRQIVADAMFYATAESWADRLEVTPSAKYEALNIAEVFAG